MKIEKLYAKDIPEVKELLSKWDLGVLTQEKIDNLQTKHWDDEEESYGIVAKDGNKVFAYAGVFYSQREYNGKTVKIANLTTVFIDQEYRGQGFYYKIAQALTELDYDFLTGVSAIEGTHRIYWKSGYVEMNNTRFLHLNKKRKNTKDMLVVKESAIAEKLDATNLKIFKDHQQFNCKQVLVDTPEGPVFCVLKKRNYTLSKFNSSKLVSYTARAIEMLLGKNPLAKQVETEELFYSNNYELLAKYFSLFTSAFFQYFTDVYGIGIREELHELLEYGSRNAKQYEVNRILAYGDLSKLKPDFLYSEVFVLDM